MDICIKLIHQGETKDQDEKRQIFAEAQPVGRDEFLKAGEKGFKGLRKFVVWASEYRQETEVECEGQRLSIYRTYGPTQDDKIELYAAERIGNNGRS